MRLALVVLALAAGTARADEAPSACAYAEHAVLAFAATELTPLPEVAGRIDLEGGARWQRGHLAIEARLGGAWAFSATAGGDVFGARAGASVGWVFPIARRIAVVPMVGYDAYFEWESAGTSTFVIHRVGVEVPVSVVVYEHVVVEPYVMIGLQTFQGSRDLAVAAGPRVAIVF